MKTKDKVAKLDKGFRHRSDKHCQDFVATYCNVLEEYAYATRDRSWNELEKTLTHVLGMYIYHRRFLEILGLKSIDVRDFVWQYEEKKEEDYKMLSEKFESLLLSVLPEYEKDE